MATSRPLIVFGALIALAAAVYFLWPPGYSFAVGAFAVASAIAILLGVRRYRPELARAWWFLAAAGVLTAAARIVYRELPGQPGTEKPDVWIVWLILLVMLTCLGCGLLGLSRSTFRNRTAWIDGAVVLLMAAVLAGVLVALPYAEVPGLTELEGTSRVAFVMRDVIIFALVVNLATAVRWNLSVFLLFLGVVGLLAFGGVFRLIGSRGGTSIGTPIDLGWIAFFTALGAAALVPSMARIDTPVSASRRAVDPLRLGLLAVAALAPFVVLLVGWSRRPPWWFEPVVGVAATLVVVLVLARTVDVAVRLQNQLRVQRICSDGVAEIAAAEHTVGVEAALRRAVRRLLKPAATFDLSLAGVDMDGGTDLSGAVELNALGPSQPRTRPAEAGPADSLLVIPLAALTRPETGSRQEVSPVPSGRPDIAGEASVVVRTDAASVARLRQPLQMLCVEAGLALHRMQLADENTRQSNQVYFRALVQNAADVILIVNDDYSICYASPSAESIFGTSDLVGTRLLDLLSPQERPAAEDLLLRAKAHPASPAVNRTGTPSSGLRGRMDSWSGQEDWTVFSEVRIPRRVEAWARDLRADPSIRGIVVTLRDVTEQRRLTDEMNYRASHDPLTGLANRHLFGERLAEEIHNASAGMWVVGVLFIDLDDFKVVNDGMGHDVGDAVLRAIGERLTCLTGAGYGDVEPVAARLGGDEFAMLIVDRSDQHSVDMAAADVVKALSTPFVLGGREINCAASVGVATTTANNADSAPELLRNADLALYAAKGAGKGQWRHFQPSMHSSIIAALDLRSSLAHALSRNELLVEYQPIVDLQHGSTVGLEALIRWQHPDRGRLMPKEFIGTAEDSGLIVPIGEWVLATSIFAARQWTSPRQGNAYVSVNVSARQFRTGTFTAIVQRLLEDYDLSPGRLMIEITESLLLHERDTAWRQLHDLHELGVHIAIDDFGTGYSSLSYLRQVPLDILKLDCEFTRSMQTSPQQRRLVEGIVRLADALGLDIIAEGIETEAERMMARDVGCAFGQGYHFSPAMPEAEVTRWLDDQTRQVQRDIGAGAPRE